MAEVKAQIQLGLKFERLECAFTSSKEKPDCSYAQVTQPL